ncbi:hypothetical protein KDX26_33070, partial [Burkholderia cenocepacia]|uniref:hypothetical protein n=1 Tax=Burkholderia cenocepacia TaxID=95486 RepID=UPI001B912C35
AGRLRLEISDEPVCYPVRRAIHAGAWITCCSTASPTKMRTGSRLLALLRACGGSKQVLIDIGTKYEKLTEALTAAINYFNEVEYGSKP